MENSGHFSGKILKICAKSCNAELFFRNVNAELYNKIYRHVTHQKPRCTAGFLTFFKNPHVPSPALIALIFQICASLRRFLEFALKIKIFKTNNFEGAKRGMPRCIAGFGLFAAGWKVWTPRKRWTQIALQVVPYAFLLGVILQNLSVYAGLSAFWRNLAQNRQNAAKPLYTGLKRDFKIRQIDANFAQKVIQLSDFAEKSPHARFCASLRRF